MSLLVRFSRIVLKIFDKLFISCLTAVCRDVGVDESPCVSFNSSIDS